MTDVAAAPRLERPPITEEFPDKQVRVGIADPDALSLSTRAWLISPNDGDFLLQLQSDRFYVNWRRRHDAYPRFSDNAGGPGLKSIALREFARFSDFCRSRPTIRVAPELTQVELTKIDMLRRGSEWSSLEELGQLLPITRAFTAIRQSNRMQFSLNEREEMPGGTLVVQISSTTDSNGDLDAVRLESRASVVLGAQQQPDAAFASANGMLNRVFFTLIPDAEQWFGSKD